MASTRQPERRGGGLRWGRIAIAVGVLAAIGAIAHAISGNAVVATVAVIVAFPILLFVMVLFVAADAQRRARAQARDALELGKVTIRLDPDDKTFATASTLPSAALAIFVLYFFDDLVGRFGAHARKLIPAMGAWAQSRGKGELSVVTPYKKGTPKDGAPTLAPRLLRVGGGYRVELEAPLDPALESGEALAASFPAIAGALLTESGIPTGTFFELLESLSATYKRGARRPDGQTVDALLADHPAFGGVPVEKTEPISQGQASQRS